MARVCYGFALRNSGMTDRFRDLVDMAVEGERLGYDSIWVSERILPTEGWNRFFPSSSIFEPLTTLAALSQRTQKVKLGTSVILPVRHPLLASRMISTIDHASKGRLIIGLGAGWHRPEIEASGVPFAQRGSVLNEQLEIFHMLWNRKKVNFEGGHYRLKDAELTPKPYQKPHPPLWMGGDSHQALKRVSKYADGWIPASPTPDEYATGVEQIKMHLSQKGSTRQMPTLAADIYTSISRKGALSRKATKYLVSTLSTPAENLSSRCIIGTPNEAIKYLSRFLNIGVKHFVFRFVPGEEHVTMRLVAADVLPNLRN